MRNATGLSKNSPINLSLTRANYEALIHRHGQYVRWMVADKCPCSLRSGRPDLNCQYCGGDGIRYSFQTAKTVISERAENLGGGYVQLACGHGQCISVRRIVGDRDKEFQAGEVFNGNLVKITGDVPERWDSLYASYDMTEEETAFASARYLGNNTFDIALSGYMTEYGSVPADIIEVLSLENQTTGEQYLGFEARRSQIIVKVPMTDPDPLDVVYATVRIVKPRKFLLLSQTANKIEQQWLDSVGGDASLSFPNEYRIGEGDVITAVVADSMSKAVLTKSGTQYDRIPEWYIADIVKIESLGTIYQKDIDYILFDRNRVMWLEKGKAPAAGENYAITFTYRPTYKVLKEFPNVRSSENQLLPRRVAVKLMNMGGQAREGI